MGFHCSVRPAMHMHDKAEASFPWQLSLGWSTTGVLLAGRFRRAVGGGAAMQQAAAVLVGSAQGWLVADYKVPPRLAGMCRWHRLPMA